MKIALVPGSFAPPTNGHLEVIKTAAGSLDKVVVAAMVNSEKTYDFSPEEIVYMLKNIVSGLDNVTVDYYDGMLWQYVVDNGISAIVKGIRSKADLDYELPMADFNKEHSGVDTLYVYTGGETADISSSLVKSKAVKGESITGLVPESIEKTVLEKYRG